jgi:hypothetical protein
VIALLAIAAGSWSRRRRVAILTLALTVQLLGWTGALIGVAIATAFALLHSEEASRVLAFAALMAGVIITPFVATSVWSVATFEGLSWLHVAVLAGAALAGALRARIVPLIVVSALVVITLAPASIVPLIHGTLYAAGDAPILTMVEETQPLLHLFGVFDLRPMLIRLGLLPLLAVVIVATWMVRRRGRDTMPVAGWLLITVTLALLHSRFSFDAAVALAAFAGLAFDELAATAQRSALMAVSFVALLPCVASYASVPTLQGYDFYSRENPLRETDMDSVTDWLHSRPAGAVLAPWSFGHWILWRAEKPVVISPMLSVGQSEFEAGMRWFFLDDDAAARRTLDAWRVRYVIVTPELATIDLRKRVARINIPDALYLRTVAARLTFSWAPVAGYREVFRSRAWTQTELGAVPLIRVYEVVR